MIFEIIYAAVCAVVAALITRELLSSIPKYKLKPMQIRGKKIGQWILLIWFIGMSAISEVHFVQPLILRILLFTVLPAALVWLAVWLTRTMGTAPSAPTADDAN